MRLLVFANATVVATPLLVYPFTYAGTRLATDVKTIGNMNNRQFDVSAGLKPWEHIILAFFSIRVPHAIEQILKTEGLKSPFSGARAEILVLTAYQGAALLLIYLGCGSAKAKPDDDRGSASIHTIRWKDP
ncbi:hypothetical protein V6N11_032629 [Hibiscus sabdariffa]|uniref:Uncharacterized protein n=1 Tax=Hibiscus sabdariffa TaxID=183260 RepID=A0ABR2T176_9ROSI